MICATEEMFCSSFGGATGNDTHTHTHVKLLSLAHLQDQFALKAHWTTKLGSDDSWQISQMSGIHTYNRDQLTHIAQLMITCATRWMFKPMGLQMKESTNNLFHQTNQNGSPFSARGPSRTDSFAPHSSHAAPVIVGCATEARAGCSHPVR